LAGRGDTARTRINTALAAKFKSVSQESSADLETQKTPEPKGTRVG
jgi:hypothetical protein